MVAGKTGTTSNYGDAWFVGWTPQMTTAVWVGYPNGLVSMAHDYQGSPVEGGTYPAIIWQSFMMQALQILAAEAPKHAKDKNSQTNTTGDRHDDHELRGATQHVWHPHLHRAHRHRQRRPLNRRSQHRGDRRRGGTAGGTGATGGGRRPPVAGPRRRRRHRSPAVAAVTPEAEGAPRAVAAARPAVAAARPAEAAAAPVEAGRPVAAAARQAEAAPAAPASAGTSVPGRLGRAPGTRLDTNRLPAAQNRQGSSTALVIPIRVSTATSTSRHAARPCREHDRPALEIAAVVLELDPERLRELARSRAQSLEPLEPAPLPHQLDAVQRLERADQHRGADALGLADCVEQRVDPVGAVHVGMAGRPEQELVRGVSPTNEWAAGSESW